MTKAVFRPTLAACALATAAAACPASAATIFVNLGVTTENFTQHGLGPVPPGVGSFATEQGAASFEGTVSTFILSGTIVGGTPGYDSLTISSSPAMPDRPHP